MQTEVKRGHRPFQLCRGKNLDFVTAYAKP